MSKKFDIAKVESSLRTQSILLTAVRALRTLLTMGIPIVLVRVLSQTEFGAYKQISLVATTAVSVLGLALPISLFYFIPRAPTRSQTFVVQTFWVFLTTSAVGGLAIALGIPLLETAFGSAISQYALWLAIMVGLSFNSLLDVVMIVDRRVHLAALRSITLDLFQGVTVVAAALLTRDLRWILAMVCVSLMLRVAFLVGYILWRGRLAEHSCKEWALREQFAYSAPYYFTTLIETARDQMAAFFVATKFSASQFALYSIGTIQLPLVGHIMQSIGETIVIEASKNFAEGNHAEMRRVWHRATTMVAYITLPIFCILQVYAEEVLGIVFGNDYIAAAPIWRVYALTLPLSVFLGATVLRGTGDIRRIIASDAASLVAGAIVLIALSDRYGIVAGAWSVVAIHAVFTAVSASKSIERLGLTIGSYLEWRSVLSIMLAAGVSAVISFVATRPLDPIARLLVGTTTAGLLYVGITWTLGLLPEHEKAFVLKHVRRMLGRFGAPGT